MIDKNILWTVIISLGVTSFGLRFLFLGVIGNRKIPNWIERHLKYTAVAFLPALVAPLVVWPSSNNGEIEPIRITAALITFICAYLTKNVILSLVIGGATLGIGLYLQY